jgi:hypothetical protein
VTAADHFLFFGLDLCIPPKEKSEDRSLGEECIYQICIFFREEK